MACVLLILVNTLAPGTALIVRGQLASGLALLLPALVGLSMWLVVVGLAQTSAWALGLIGLLTYLLSALSAAVVWWRVAGRGRPDPEQVRALHRVVAAHYLRGEWPAALPAARRLALMASEEAGAWRILELVAQGAGDARIARHAAARARRCDNAAPI